MPLRDAVAASIRLVCGVTLKAVPFLPETETPENGQRIFYANHVSNLDFPVIWASLPRVVRNETRPVAALDYWTHNRTRRFLSTTIFRAVLVDRSGSVPPERKTEVISDALRGGSSIIIFPEGGRSESDSLKPFKSGLFHLAKEHPSIPLVPVWLENSGRILPKGEFLPVPLLTTVTFGAPFRYQSGEGKEQFLDSARRTLLELGAPSR